MNTELYSAQQIDQAIRHDPRLHAIIKTLASLIEEYEITPAEARACAVYAATIVEQRRRPSLTLSNAAHDAIRKADQARAEIARKARNTRMG